METPTIIKQAAKSKTINFNTWVPVILGILSLIGVAIPTPAIVGGIALVNILLRYVTKVPLKNK